VLKLNSRPAEILLRIASFADAPTVSALCSAAKLLPPASQIVPVVYDYVEDTAQSGPRAVLTAVVTVGSGEFVA